MQSSKLLHLCFCLSLAITSLGCPTRTIYYDDGGAGAAGHSQGFGGSDGGTAGHQGSAGGAGSANSQSGGAAGSVSAGGADGVPGTGGTISPTAGTGGTISSAGGTTGVGGSVGHGGVAGGVGGQASTPTCQSATDCKAGFSCVATVCTANAFSGSPCVMNQDDTELVYAHGLDHGIYLRGRSGGVWSSWTKTQLDGSQIAQDSAFGCSEGMGDVQIVAPSASPAGQMLYAEGNGVQFGSFQHLLGTETFSPLQISISAGHLTQFYLVGAMDAGPQVWMNNQGAWTELTPISSQTTPYVSAIDVALQGLNPVWLRIVAGFERSGQLGIYTNVLSMGSGSWQASGHVSPPPSHLYGFSPAICADNFGTDGDVHLVTVTEDGQIWDSHYAQQNAAAQMGIAPWELVGHGAASSARCAIMPDSSVRIAVLDSTGHVSEIEGSPGSWVQTDLGTY